MSDTENNNVPNESVEQPAQEAAPAVEKEVEAMRNHQAKLLDELKQTQARLQTFEERESQIEADRLEKAKQANDHKQLYEDAMKKLEESNGKYTELQSQISKKEVAITAQTIANELANDKDSAQLMAQLLKDRLKYDGGDIKVLNSAGELTVSNIEQFKQEILNTPVYAPLLKGNHSSGGDASLAGKASGSSDPKVIPNDEFLSMNPLERAQKIAEGYTFEKE